MAFGRIANHGIGSGSRGISEIYTMFDIFCDDGGKASLCSVHDGVG